MWRSLPDGKEKYAAYLCSSEWGQLRRAVKERSKGQCERCRVNPVEATHHLTYARKYSERLDDLQGICNLCHDEIHGHSERRPRSVGRSVYLAGKVEKNCWRHSVVPTLRSSMIAGDNAVWNTLPNAIVVKRNDVDYSFDYSGPFFLSCDHGCCHSPGTHGWNELNGGGNATAEEWDADFNACFSATEKFPDEYQVEHGNPNIQEFVFDSCIAAIKSSDIVLAWVDCLTAFGTLVEIGMAYAMGKDISIGCPSSFDPSHLWFSRFCGTTYITDTPKEFVESSLRCRIRR